MCGVARQAGSDTPRKSRRCKQLAERAPVLLNSASMTNRLAPALLLTLGLMACGGPLGDKGKGKEMDAALRSTLQSSTRPPFATKDQEGAKLWKLTQQFYTTREYEPAWIRNNAEPRPNMEALVKALGEARDHGLDPELYGFSALQKRLAEASEGFLSDKGFDPTEAGRLDVWLTYLYMKYASDLADGLSNLASADPTWQIKAEKVDPLPHLEDALAKKRIVDSLEELTPDNQEYRLMRKALAGHRAVAERGGWPPVPANLRLKPGQAHVGVHALAQRLSASGDYEGAIPREGPAAYDHALQEAVRRFQRRHGLDDDAIVNAAVAADLNAPIEQRIQALELNLERWRWLPRDPGRRFMVVNVPEMRLQVWENGQVPLSMRVIVGKRDTPTPIFNDEMTHIVFSPYWNVPPNIAQEETLPSFLRDPAFLARNNMEVVNASGQVIDPSSIDWMDPSSFRFRQRPGSDNALGLVKFMFPNKFDVYLHDTPTDSLFGRGARLFSHGCIRVEKPEDLAAYVLRDQPEWTPGRIREAMHAGQERTVKLREPIPVFIGYWTARVTPDGIAQFRKDVYGIDARQSAMVAHRLRQLRASTTAAVAATSGKAAKPHDDRNKKKNKK
jgi:murein L,D-transpeptidase YcbB/YkuD